MYEHSTIAAIATPSGSGGVAIVRISGERAREVGARVFRSLPTEAESHRLYSGSLLSASGSTIDRALAVWMRAPNSYTGEDVVELHCHGGSFLARKVLEATLAAGARPAERGEFTRRAFLNGRMDLAQAESVADVIAARSSGALVSAVAQLRGELSHEVERLRDVLLGLAAELEVSIDFTEEDVGELDVTDLRARAGVALAAIEQLLASFRRGRMVREGARIVLAGKPNVGKSSLLNAMLRTDRAIVTETAGTTRDVIEEGFELDGLAVTLLDTAGLRQTTDRIEQAGVARTRAELERADLVVVVVDGATGLDEEDAAVFDATRQIGRICLINKADLDSELSSERLREALSLAPDEAVVRVSAKTGAGVSDLLDRVRDHLLGSVAAGGSEVVVTRERHAVALEQAREHLAAFEASAHDRVPADLLAVDLMSALEALGEIVGVSTSEDVLDRIFRDFCIGK